MDTGVVEPLLGLPARRRVFVAGVEWDSSLGAAAALALRLPADFGAIDKARREEYRS